ncbi:hypothetical protein CJP72_09375 [Citrobacter sp. NCU1]|nr:hypothetical protein [Citrobacter sp. NCU1]
MESHLRRRINVEPHQERFNLLYKTTSDHILCIDDRNHSHYHCTVDYLIFPSLANHLVSCPPLCSTA